MIPAFDSNERLKAALTYASRGWHIFPVKCNTKGRDATGRSTHLLPNGHNGATADTETIRSWWRQWPDANIGLNLSASGLVALDPDLYKPECAWERFISDKALPRTLVQASPRGGRHYIFRAKADDQYAGSLCAGVEIKHRGYILLEPSTFEGGTYRFETDLDPAPVPDWVPRKGGANAMRSDREAGVRHHAADTASASEVEELLSWLDPDAEGYDAWLEVLQALHDHFGGGDDGLAIAEAWSARGALFRPGEVTAKWRGFRLGGGVTLRTVASRARDNGADLGAIARRHSAVDPRARNPPQLQRERPDLSHDQLALDLGQRSWDANARYVAIWDRWLFWTGTCWQRDETLEHVSRARAYLRTRAVELQDWADKKATGAGAGPGGLDPQGARNWAREQGKTLRNKTTVMAVVNLARANPASAATHEAFDADRLLLGTPGGTVDLRTGVLRLARREDMISRQTTCEPAEVGASAPRWTSFLREIMDGDEETIGFLQRAAGYALTGATTEHKLLFLHGSGRNGKSVFLNTLLDIWGDYGRRVAASTFLNSQTERHPTDLASLQGARLAIASELPRGKTWDEATIKDLTGGDRMTARFMRQDFFEFEPQLTLMIAGNTQPSFRGVDEAIRSRVVLVPFRVTIPEAKRDGSLGEKLRQEAPAILRWCIDGAVEWQRRGLDVPPAIAAASAAYFDEEDTLRQFLQDETRADLHAIVSTDDLMQRFVQWSDRQGLDAWSKRTLVKELKMRGFTDAASNGSRGLRGLRLR